MTEQQLKRMDELEAVEGDLTDDEMAELQALADQMIDEFDAREGRA